MLARDFRGRYVDHGAMEMEKRPGLVLPGNGTPASCRDTSMSTPMYADPLNVIRAIAERSLERDPTHGERIQAMPAFGSMLSDREMVEPVSYLRQRRCGRPGDVTTEAAGPAREKRDTTHYV